MKIVSIQILRGAAALLVIYTHAANITAALHPETTILTGAAVGAAGVDVFFVISGFIMVMTASGKHGLDDYVGFIRDRVRRIVPIYYLASLPFIVWGIKVFGFSPGKLVASLLFFPAGMYGMNEPYLAVGWTLCFEVLFYACVAATILGRRAVIVPVLLALFGLAVVTRNAGFPALSFVGNPIILEFCAGCLIACAWKGGARGRAALVAGAILLLCWSAAPREAGLMGDIALSNNTLDGAYSWSRVVWFGLPAAALVALAVCLEEPIARSRTLRRMSYLGDASYSLYLWHPLVFVILAKAWRWAPGTPAPAVFAISIVIALASGVVIYRYVERPLGRALRGGPRQRLAPSVADVAPV